ncbi:hypothetical protein MNB_SV-15-1193 [hydrothermal vent metagenome]|uniref:Uncharacterized protein n=1 Tax=hydrothermal vent metagenome TaxID=652676 RepID=A0A1W1ELC8_9ZZZZ
MLFFTILLSLKYYQSTPLEPLFGKLHFLIYGFTVVFLFLYLINRMHYVMKIDGIILYYSLLCFIIPIYSGLVAYVTFGQPMMFGVASQRLWFSMGSAIYIYYLLSSNKLSLEKLEKMFVFITWLSIGVFFYFIFFVNPYKYITGSGPNFVTFEEGRGLRYKFNSYFISFGVIYYYIKATLEKKKKYTMAFLVFLYYIVAIIQGRTFMILTLATLGIFSFFELRITLFVKKVLVSIVALIMLLTLLGIVKPELLASMAFMFGQLFTVLSGGESDDASANARIHETHKVMERFSEDPMSVIHGVGYLSAKWQDGFFTYFGYFFPPDIGLLGATFVYGTFGMLLLFIIPAIITYLSARKIKNSNNAFILTMKYMLFYIFVSSLAKGTVVFTPFLYLMPLMIMYYFTKVQKMNFKNSR